MKRKYVVLVFITFNFLLTCFQCNYKIAFAFEINVHEKITENAIIHSVDEFNDHLNSAGLDKGIDEILNSKTIKVWLMEGSKQEDEPLLDFRYLNHFYNPLDGNGLHDGIFTGKSSYEWASPDQGNLWSWAMMRSYYYTGLVAKEPEQRGIFLGKAFRSLGQNFHLVQDNAVPAHVRNDGHPEGDGFEGYTKRDDIVDHLNYTPYSFANSLISVSPYAPRQFWDSNTYTLQNPNPSSNKVQGLAEYTNANFASEDTIFTENNLNDWNPFNDSKYFPHPARAETVLYDEFLKHNETIGYDVYRRYFLKNNGGEEIKHFAYAGRLYKYYVSQATDWEKTLGLDDQCYKDYAQKLIPRAVGYSAGLLNYFLRGKVFMEKDTQNAGKYIIKNESSERMEGTFALFYDDSTENRNIVQGASWMLTINPNSQSVPVTFTEPTSPAQKEKGKYILVFNGKLGMEEGAVVGRAVKLVTIEPKYSISIKAIDPPHVISGYDWIYYYFNGYDWIQYKPWDYYIDIGNWILGSNQMLTGLKDSVTLEITVNEATGSASLSKDIRLAIDPKRGGASGSGSLSEPLVRTDNTGKGRVIFTKGNERTGYDQYGYGYSRYTLYPEWRGVYVTASLVEDEKVSSKIPLQYRDPLNISISYYDPIYFMENWAWEESLAALELPPNDNDFRDAYWPKEIFKITTITFGDGSSMSKDCYLRAWCDMWFPTGTDH